ncbi:MAG TPA: hypothetical protein VI997_04965, partial [Candidatus Thermoplasmatota archaeon]|nr:hypothetical protein [Candidatus Thermoplasmatota archaeon]
GASVALPALSVAAGPAGVPLSVCPDEAPATGARSRRTTAAILADPTTQAPRDRLDVSELAAPLVLRAHVGDCVTMTLTNVLRDPSSIHVHDVVAPPGAGEAIGLDAPDLTPPGGTRIYTVYIPPWPGMEGGHFLHSHADPREQTRHGMFGVLAAEPADATWVSTKDGVTPAPSGLEAMIVRANAPDFREFVQIYHDEVSLVDWQLTSMPSISEYGEYGPGTKAIDLRSEPFRTRFVYHDTLRDTTVLPRGHDKSQSYGSYTYGDPGVIIPQSYVGDPVKFRYVNAGPGQYHIHHLHGGGIRWKATPLAEPTEFAIRLVKDHPNQASASQRLDVQNAGPGESFTLEPEGGTGGVQQGVGDFLFHCHIAEHYLAGMWSFWRSLNVLQPGVAELPDRAGDVKPAVDSLALIGTVLADGEELTTANIDAWIEAQLPAKGVPGEEDASVWDWRVQSTPSGPLYLGEPETPHAWPNYPADAPGRVAAGTRPALTFDPDTGRLAYPHLRPHLGARPPFAPDHGPAPFLTPTVDAKNPAGLCPAESRVLRYDVVAIQARVQYNKFDSDAAGQVFVLAPDRAAATAPDAKPTSILLRANSGDCVDLTLTSTLKEKGQASTRLGIHTKTNIHIHLVQFDVQASDGVVAGFNYETTLRSLEGGSKTTDRLDPSAAVVSLVNEAGLRLDGATTLVDVSDVRPFFDRTRAVKVGSAVGLGLGLETIESLALVSVEKVCLVYTAPPRENVVKECPATLPATITQSGPNAVRVNGTIRLAGAPVHAHSVGESIGYEFVRYRWFPDVELGIVYFHDHVDGLNTWRRGLFGTLVVEPRGSRWMSPVRADDTAPDEPTAHIADVVPPGGDRSFRELVLHFQERACVGALGDNCLSEGAPAMPDRVKEPAAFNLRAEPLYRRNADAPFSSAAPLAWDEPSTPYDDSAVPQGDPSTDVLEAYPGDEVRIRVLYTGQSQTRSAATFGVTGHRFKVEQDLPGGRTVDAVSMAISSHHNFRLECGAGGCQRLPGDYLYWMTQPDVVERGAWGLLRVRDPVDGTPIRPLSSNPTPAAGQIPGDAPVRRYDVAAVERLVMHNPTQLLSSTMRVFTTLDEATSLQAADPMGLPRPLVLRALPGEIVEVSLTNMLPDGRVGMHAALLSAGPGDQGVTVGDGPEQTIGVGETRVYRWYADREVGTVDLVSLADPVNDANTGLSAVLVIEPEDVTFLPAVGASARLTFPGGGTAREHVVMFSNGDAQFESSTMPYFPDVQGLSLVNFATEPLVRRAMLAIPTPSELSASGAGVSTCHVDAAGCLNRPFEVRNPWIALATWGILPATPTFFAEQGEPVVMRVVGASGSQLQTFHLDGHAFAQDPDMENCRDALELCKSNLISVVTVGPRETRDVWVPSAGPGGAGDYLYRAHRDAFFEAGMWGLLRVL